MRYFLEHPKRIIELALSGLVLETFWIVWTNLDAIHHLATTSALGKFILYSNSVFWVLLIMAIAAVINVVVLLFHNHISFDIPARIYTTLTFFTGYLFLALVAWILLGPGSVTWSSYVFTAIIAAALHIGVRLEKGEG